MPRTFSPYLLIFSGKVRSTSLHSNTKKSDLAPQFAKKCLVPLSRFCVSLSQMKRKFFTSLLLLLLFVKCTTPAAYKNDDSAMLYDYNLSPFENAEKQYSQSLKAELAAVGYSHTDQIGRLFLRAFKTEKKLEVWIEKPDAAGTLLFKEYDFAGFSGTLGPKRKEGDRQIPEGVYHIDRFNPHSKFHLSLSLNYPNKSDRILGHPTAPGSDIFLHGNTQTVGCIPITDLKIRELYLLSTFAKESGQQQIPVYIFPFKMTDEKLNAHKTSPHFPFWKNLKTVYDKTKPQNIFPEKPDIDHAGNYL